MVVGLPRFKEQFENFTDHYILIGGAACTLAMESFGLTFRATRDLDIVLCVEALDVEFAGVFWDFIRDGGYQAREKATGERQFYRFREPTDTSYPAMLELFSRPPDFLTPAAGSHLTPIPFAGEISSLSAILMDDAYYEFLQSGKRVVDGVRIAGAEQLIPLKACAWLDLNERRRNAGQGDSRDIKKHRNDVLRLSAIVDRDLMSFVPETVKKDLNAFLAAIGEESIDLGALGLRGQTLASVMRKLQEVYELA